MASFPISFHKGYRPENIYRSSHLNIRLLPVPEKSIQQIEKEQMKRLKDKAKKGKLMLDE